MTSAVPHRHAGPAPGARALYLGARERKQVHCTEEALVVRNERAQTLRYPVARVARVVSSTTVDWSGGAIALCLMRGIGITWLSGSGESLGTCYPQRRGQDSLATALELLLEAPDGPTRYQNWLRSRRMDVLMRWGTQSADRIDPLTWENTKREWVYHQRIDVHLPTALRGLCMAFVGAQLATHGIQPLLWDANAQRIDADQDLCSLLWAEMNLKAGSLAQAADSELPMTALFERNGIHNASALQSHLHSLQRMAMKAMHT